MAPAKIDGAIGIEDLKLPARTAAKISETIEAMVNPKKNWAKSNLVGATTNSAMIVINLTSPNPRPAKTESEVPTTKAIRAQVK